MSFTGSYTEAEPKIAVQSTQRLITCGIPQGSTLGPSLFLQNIKPPKKLIFTLFADDTNIFYSWNDLNKLGIVINEEFSNVLKYCAANKLSTNNNKFIISLLIHLNSKFEFQKLKFTKS